jgi:hypothetical protein
MLAWLLLLLVNVVTMYFSGQVALRRGRSLRNWLWLGAVFGPFALVTVALLPPLQKAAIS